MAQILSNSDHLRNCEVNIAVYKVVTVLDSLFSTCFTAFIFIPENYFALDYSNYHSDTTLPLITVITIRLLSSLLNLIDLINLVYNYA